MVGPGWSTSQLERMVTAQHHRGPDGRGLWAAGDRTAGLGHNRLAIIDLSDAGLQPMESADGRMRIVFNGEVYNYLELRSELADFSFRSRTDTEVVLAAYQRWGESCLDRFVGMFAFAIWDERDRRLFMARDRFGVKPLYWHQSPEGGLWFASEIKAFHAAGLAREPDEATWATYLVSGLYDHGTETFWRGVHSLEAGTSATWTERAGIRIRRWYDPHEAAAEAGPDLRGDDEVLEHLHALLSESVRLRFRSDVPVGVCLSGGLDSSLLLALIRELSGLESEAKAFTFECGDPNYDETPWVKQMLAGGRNPSCICRLQVGEVPELASRIQRAQDEPFGGIPTLGMAKVHARARAEGVTVLLDGNGLDEGWAGYDYYRRAATVDAGLGPVQGSVSNPVRADSLRPEFAAMRRPFEPPRPFGDPLLDLQYRDLRYSKIPRAMRFADRVSMAESRELREPLLDHRVVELGLRQPLGRKVRDGLGKWLPRALAARLLPRGLGEAPKRAVQTPQREWLRGPLAPWCNDLIEWALGGPASAWLDASAVRRAWWEYRRGESDNSFFVWQWLSLGLMGLETPDAAVTPRLGSFPSIGVPSHGGDH